jgi:hypothetical protein
MRVTALAQVPLSKKPIPGAKWIHLLNKWFTLKLPQRCRFSPVMLITKETGRSVKSGG